MFDADGDGRKDLLLSLDWAPWYFILLRRTGLDLFQVYNLSGGGQGPLFLWDVDADGTQEILAGTAGGAAAFRLGRPLNDWVVSEIPLQEGPSLFSGTFGDLDHDGVLDQVGIGGKGLSIIFGTLKDGLPNLDGTAVTTDLPGSAVPPGFRLRDLNGDGLEDILFPSNFYFLQERGRSYRAARPTGLEQAFSGGGQAFDLNGDGYDDLARIFEGKLQISLGSEEGFRPPFSAAVPLVGDTLLVAGRLRAGDPGLVLIHTGGKLQLVPVGSDGRPGEAVEVGLPFPRVQGLALGPWNGEAADHLLEIRRTMQGAAILSVFDLSNLASPVEVFKSFVPNSSFLPRAADLDADGKTDLIFVTDSGVQIIRGNLAESTLYQETALAPWDEVDALAAIDIEGDGLWEVAASGRTAGDSSVRLFRRAAGGGWGSQLLSRTRARALRVVDLEGDRSPDVVALGSGFQVFRNRGQGLVLPPDRVPLDTTGDSLEVLDLDGDGRLDLVSLDYYLITACYAGPDGQFPRPTELAMLSSHAQLGSADFNGDGLVDFVVNQEFGNDAVILGTPDRSYARLSDLPGDAAASAQIVAGDFDGNGKPDLVANLWKDRMLYLVPGRGDGTFDLPQPLPVPEGFSAQARLILTTGSLDGDDRPDLVAYAFPSSLHVHPGGESFLTSKPMVLDAGGKIRAGTIIDLDFDGKQDLLVTIEDPRVEVLSRCFPGNGDGSFAEAVEVKGLNFLSSYVLGDLDGDQLPDAAVSYERGGSFGILLGRGGFAFSEPLPLPGAWTAGVQPLAFEDLDGDSVLDVVGSFLGSHGIVVFKGLGKGEFAEPRIFGPANPLLFHDMNGDGLPDLLHSFASGGNPNPLSIIYASPVELLSWPRAYHLFEGGEALVSGDFNGDGRRALAVTTHRHDFIRLLMADGDRQLRQAEPVPLADHATEGEPLFVAASDLDGDDRQDLVMLSGGSLWWLRSLGVSSFEDPRRVLSDVPMNPISFPDLNGDGTADLLISGFSVARGLGGGGFEEPRTYLQAGALPSAVGDFNGDGLLDVVQSMGRSGATLQFQGGAGGGRFDGYEALASAGWPLGGLAIGDFNGDRLLDIAQGITGAQEKAAPRVWYGRRGGFLERGADLHDPAGVDEGTAGLVAVDLDRDGFDDLLSADPGGYLLIYSGSSRGLKETPLVTQGPRNPDLLLAGNFTGDSTLDLLTGGPNGLFLIPGGLTGTVLFRRGDADDNGRLDISDPVFLLGWLFLGGRRPACLDAADIDDSGDLNINDPVFLLEYLYLGGLPPPEPFSACGQDPNPDARDCQSFAACRLGG
jgi:hypothetical protein